MKIALKSFTCFIIMVFAVVVFHTDRNSYYVESYRAIAEQKDGASVPSIDCAINLIAPYSVSPRISLQDAAVRTVATPDNTFVKFIASILDNNHFNTLQSQYAHIERISATSRSLANYYIYALNRIRI